MVAKKNVPRVDHGPVNSSLVLIMGSKADNLSEGCSGVLIAPNYVLTSEKCVEGLGKTSNILFHTNPWVDSIWVPVELF